MSSRKLQSIVAMCSFLAASSCQGQLYDVLRSDSTHFIGTYIEDRENEVLFRDSLGSTVYIARSEVVRVVPLDKNVVQQDVPLKEVVIKTTEGKEITGRLIKETSDSLLLNFNGIEGVVLRSSIEEIKYISPKKLERFWECGGVLGTPAAFNLVVGYHDKVFGVRITGMYFDDVSGVTFEFPITVLRNNESSKSIVPMFMRSYIEGDYGSDYLTGIGIAYDYTNISGFHWQLGFAFGKTTYSNPQIIGRIGYVHQFR